MQGQIVQHIVALARRGTTILVAIDGCGGAGKSHLAGYLSGRLSELSHLTTVIHFDDFYVPQHRRSQVTPQPIGPNFDWQRLRDQVLLPLRGGKSAKYDRYDWPTEQLAEKIDVPATGIVMVEGVSCSRIELATLYDLRIWVQCPREVRLIRGIERDGETSRLIWEQEWMPAEEKYVEAHRPDLAAELIVDGTREYE